MAVDIEIDVQCGGCGGSLNAKIAYRTSGFGGVICEVDPCDTCLEKAKEEGRDEGREES